MFLPPGFGKAIAVEAADLVLQAYEQYQAFLHSHAWAVKGITKRWGFGRRGRECSRRVSHLVLLSGTRLQTTLS